MADRFASRLSAEAQSWVGEGLISDRQAEQILARYPARPSWGSRPVVLFSVIGGALIAAGLALVVAHNWDALHRWAKLGGVVALTGAAYVGGLALRDRGYSRIGEGFLVIGGSLLLVGIALIAQIYNLSGRPSDAVLLWWALLLPAAYALPSMALGTLGYLGTAYWYWGAISDPSTLLGRGLLGSRGLEDLSRWNPVPILFILMAVAAFGMVYFGLGALHGDGDYRRLRQLLEQIGLLALFGGLLPFGFLWRARWSEPGGGVSLTLVVLVVVALLAILLAYYRLPEDSAGVRLGLIGALLVLLLYLAALKVAIGFGASAEVLRALAIANWALLFGASLVFVLYGARWDRTSWINWGVVFIGIHAIARYIDLFGTMLQTSLLFVTAGAFVLLLGVALERVRRRMTAQVATRRGGV